MNDHAAQPFEVFLSHFAEEQAIGEELQDYLHLVFGNGLRVFRSSDDGSIRTGEDQYPAILQALDETKIYVVLVSKYSAYRPWLNFEVGFGKARGSRLFPVLIRDTREADVPTPLAQLELRTLATQAVVEEIVHAIAGLTGRPILAQNTNWFLTQLHKSEASMPKRELSVVPFRFSALGESLGFDLRYNGARPIRLVKIWAEVPSTVLDKSWYRAGVTGFLVSETVEREGKSCLRLEYIANTGTPDIRESGFGFRPLPRHQAPSAEPFFLRELRFALDVQSVAKNPTEVVRCQVITEDGTSQQFEYRLSAIEVRQGFGL